MLYYNLKRIFKARGIEKPYTFFIAHGFSQRYAYIFNKGIVPEMKLKYLEKVCEILKCTPHDILVWEPDKKTVAIENHPLSILRGNNQTLDVLRELRTMPLQEIEELQVFINKKKEEDQR
jgi:DNA-binding Xre family transcriptional regulator